MNLFLDRLLPEHPGALMSMILALLLACTVSSSDSAVEQEQEDAAPVQRQAPAGLQARSVTGACEQGEILTIDLETTTPIGYSVEVQYADGTFEPMQASIHIRSSQAILNEDAGMSEYESPIYRRGSMLTFTCGYAWEDTQAGPRIDGTLVGLAAGYRVSWIPE